MSTLGVITALPLEFSAVKLMLDNAAPARIPHGRGSRAVVQGTVPAEKDGNHSVVLVLAGMGNNQATWSASRLLSDFPEVRVIFMVGIAGGVPYPSKPDNHVRLGDIVVSDRNGVVQYDLVKDELDAATGAHRIDPRFPPRPPDAALLHYVDLLAANEVLGERPWIALLERGNGHPAFMRPDPATDILIDSSDGITVVRHPIDQLRSEGQPRVFRGPIASANRLLKNPRLRDELRDAFNVKAIEMEGSGIADATWNSESGYLVIRGICDYCDRNKSDKWQPYAALTASAYFRALASSMSTEQISSVERKDGLLPEIPEPEPGFRHLAPYIAVPLVLVATVVVLLIVLWLLS